VPPRLVSRLRVAPLLVLLALPACRPPPRIDHPNVLLITLDTTRADRLGVYGYARPTSPVLDALAREGAFYERAHSVSSWTLPAHASLFTGLLPRTHGAEYDPAGPLVLGNAILGPERWKKIRARGLRPDVHTLAELVGAAGYRTGGVAGGPWLKRVFGLSRGFGDWNDDDITNVNGRSSRSVTDAAIAWLDSGDDRPFLLFLNYFDPHTPFYPARRCVAAIAQPSEIPQGMARTPAELSVLYDGEIRCMDEQIGRLFDHLRARGLYDRTWILALADHGEMLGEHGEIGHGNSLYEPELRIPLIVKPPRGDGPRGRIHDPIQTADLFPMILARLGIAVPPGTQGLDPRPPDAPLLAEVEPSGFGERGAWRAILSGDLKYLESGAGDRLLFDIARDPYETHDLAAERPDRAAALRADLEQRFAALPVAKPSTAAETPVDAATRHALESLGYLRSDGGSASDGD
jgi:arylsulfatase A-like enzyme